MSLQIRLDANRTTYTPGEEITGAVAWQLPAPPRLIDVQLSWTTRGKGTVDNDIVFAQNFENLPASGERPFSLKLPTGPYSFSGKLISVLWQVRALVRPSDDEVTIPITVSPTGPYSFSGKLISVLWQVRALVRPSDDEVTIPITVSPTGQEIDLTRLSS